MLQKSVSNQFEKDYVKQFKRNKDLSKLKEAMKMLMDEVPLPSKYKDHPLKGNWASFRDCHIEPDWILIYKYYDGIVHFERTGTHADLFE
jgi:mRNA interferase YafQ